jgi:hypothetical protein
MEKAGIDASAMGVSLADARARMQAAVAELMKGEDATGKWESEVEKWDQVSGSHV